MAVSIFELFKIGIGPSSSHTVGPMLAACTFIRRLNDDGKLQRVASLQATLYGSLAHTGRGHGTDKAVLLGFGGALPDKVDPDTIAATLEEIESSGQISLLGRHAIPFTAKKHLVFNKRKVLPHHPNGMHFEATDEAGKLLASRHFYSVGGGFVVSEDEAAADRIVPDATRMPYPFDSCDSLRAQCDEHGLTIAEIMMANERAWRSEEEIRTGLLEIWSAMQACIQRGYENPGVLPGGLKVRRRAPDLHQELSQKPAAALRDQLTVLDWVNLWALAVNEENAAGGRVVTAPTNGAAGIIPAVLSYYDNCVHGADQDGVLTFLLTAGAVGILYLTNASISGAEVGCQGEVGVACSMAAGGLTAAMGGNMGQVENAAEIGMEHNLGLTCDPVGGLVQIPCIERNAMATTDGRAW
jgi:L-serine dehydratase